MTEPLRVELDLAGAIVEVDEECLESADEESGAGLDDIPTPLTGAPRRRSSISIESSEGSGELFEASAGDYEVTVDSDMLEIIEEQPSVEGVRARRRSSVSIKSIGEMSGQSSARSSDSDLPPRAAARRRTTRNVASGDGSATQDSSSSSLRPSMGRARKSTRRASINLSSGKTSGTSSFGSSSLALDTALETLGRQSNSEWENVAAAATVVAGGTTAAGQRSHGLFSVNEKVLVFLNILNMTNRVDDPEDFTVNPVNKYGFPKGGGKSFEDSRGPFAYVLCTVLRVHFDEDVRYYTVRRADTGSEQRSDSEWMEPIASREGQEQALNAARQTARSVSFRESTKDEPQGCAYHLACLRRFLLWPYRYTQAVLFPCYQKVRQRAKTQITHMLHGDSPFAFRLRLTGINLLVLFSFIYLFIEVVQYAFFPASWDYAVTVVAFIVWIFLVLELLFERLIRPCGYYDLMKSDKAYAPSTARHISRFHLIAESVALLMFLPNFNCLTTGECGKSIAFTTLDAAMRAIVGDSSGSAVFGRFVIGLSGFRFVGLVRHWKQMWLNHAFTEENNGLVHDMLIRPFVHNQERRRKRLSNKRKEDENDDKDDEEYRKDPKPLNEEDQRLRKAATIGTALMVINSSRAMILLITIMTVFPMILVIRGVNQVAYTGLDLLLQNNIAAGDDCEYLFMATLAWVEAYSLVATDSIPKFDDTTYLLWAQVLPVRCPFQGENGVITHCNESSTEDPRYQEACSVYKQNVADPSAQFFADQQGLRVGGILDLSDEMFVNGTEYYVRALFNENNVVTSTNFTVFLLLLMFLAFTLFGLSCLRNDAGRLVLDPLQRMLKIVLRYAENPLAKTERGGTLSTVATNHDKKQLGNYETEQLINAITKIADLLRTCWGIAGAGIISSNLARTQEGKTVVFNPTVPGRRVYALFGFVGINGFSDQLRALDRDVMILINDVAKVVHDEVFRWALGDSGQCNKNLGGAFLMVFRIGDVTEVRERQKRATDVVFEAREKGTKKKSSNLKRRGMHGRNSSGHGRFVRQRRRSIDDDTLELASLPGIQSFTDRALLGMLKAFASLHRDRAVQKWCKDFRLGAGVGAFSVEIIVGMDAGWAMEGAVGSEYKIDATYLSPHVNMAARMMTASKQYGVTILMSQAVEELLSINARSKLRHLDTVYVKGSQVKQRIFTYDARYKGVDFFLFDKSEEQANQESENYSQRIWDMDQDLNSMRQHVTDDFKKKFEEGKDQYLAGNWRTAIETLKKADDIMITTVLEEGYIDYNPDDIDPRIFDRRNVSDEILRLRQELGDGACRTLVGYMENRRGKPPANWEGVRPLTSK